MFNCIESLVWGTQSPLHSRCSDLWMVLGLRIYWEEATVTVIQVRIYLPFPHIKYYLSCSSLPVLRTAWAENTDCWTANHSENCFAFLLVTFSHLHSKYIQLASDVYHAYSAATRVLHGGPWSNGSPPCQSWTQRVGNSQTLKAAAVTPECITHSHDEEIIFGCFDKPEELSQGDVHYKSAQVSFIL